MFSSTPKLSTFKKIENIKAEYCVLEILIAQQDNSEILELREFNKEAANFRESVAYNFQLNTKAFYLQRKIKKKN